MEDNMNQVQQFIDTIESHAYQTSNSLKRLVRMIKTLDFSKAILLFREIENTHSDPKHSKNVIGDRMPLFSLFFGNFMLEKCIAYSEGNKEVYLNDGSLFFKDDQVQISILYNNYNSIFSKPINSEISDLASLLVPIMGEQMKLQRGAMPYFDRFYRIFGEDQEINSHFREKHGIGLKSVILLSFLLYSYVEVELNRKDRHIFGFEFENFSNFITRSSLGIKADEVRVFLDSISLTREGFQDKYFEYRTDFNTGKLFDYDQQSIFDKALPRVSYSYPLYIDKSGLYAVISNASLKEFLKMDRIYRMLTLEISGDFKGRYVGPAIEEYARSLIRNYSKFILDSNPICGGNEKYGPKGKKRDEPDVLLETDDYIVLIECKANPFNMDLFKLLNKGSLEKLVEDVQVSVENIEKYLEYHQERLQGKKVLKFLAYYEGDPMVFGLLKDDIEDAVPGHELMILGFDFLELLFYKHTVPLPELFEGYKTELVKREGQLDLEMYLNSLGVSQASMMDKSILRNLLKDHGFDFSK